ncbi:MAG TPA: hypothetical protein VEQ59_01290, partial [Polyangiaceae bacterium]|nr:hypothetical protein [Polyangiaceae bacterium]
MRKRPVLFAWLAFACLVGAASGQPGKKAPAVKEEDRARAAAKAEPEKADKPAAGDAAASGANDDLGAPPPKDVAEQKPETKPSPLTPKPEEFPSGVAK